MRIRRIVSFAVVPVVAIPLALAAASQASSASPSIIKGNGYVIVNSANAVSVKGQKFYPTGPISPDTLVVISAPDGSLPGGMTVAQLAKQVEQRKISLMSATTPLLRQVYHNSYGATSAGWSTAYNGTSIIGLNNSATVSYSFNVSVGTSQVNAGQGWGYYRGYNGSVFGTWGKFFGLDSADSDTIGGGVVPWGNVAATARFRAKCAASTVCGGAWNP